ncbi:Rho-binding antiterminator [bacterium SCSIO 12696]|nr:Rho-binding antiterminator [bacterium SCSIO 12696]
MPYSPIPCSIHDHLELACIAGALLRIDCDSGETLEATAITIQARSDKTEWLLCQLPDNKQQAIRLDHIKGFEPISPKGLFPRIELP